MRSSRKRASREDNCQEEAQASCLRAKARAMLDDSSFNETSFKVVDYVVYRFLLLFSLFLFSLEIKGVRSMVNQTK